MSDPGLEIATEAAKAAAVEIVSPATTVLADVIGGTFGDRLSNWRKSKPAWEERNRRETLEAAARTLAQKGIETPADDMRPECIEEIVAAAGETSAPELKQLYAKLIAAAIDPQRSKNYRREFVDIVKGLEPIDCMVLPILADQSDQRPSREAVISAKLKMSVDQVLLAFRNLIRLELAESPEMTVAARKPYLTALGRQFLAAVQ